MRFGVMRSKRSMRSMGGAALLLCAVPLHAAGRGMEPDTARLREALAAAFGADIQIVRTELSSGLRERGGTFWLVHARPRRSGDYELRYRYDYRDHARPADPLYTHVEHTSYIRVGEQGCWRRREGRDVCLGDTVILPFVVNDYTGHTFHLTWRGPPSWSSWQERAADPALDSLPNPLSAHLRLVGTESGEMLRRNGGGSVIYAAILEAVAPGRFNLVVTSREAGDAQPPMTEHGSVPVIIVPRGQPVTVLLERETVVGTNARDGFSSHSGSQYLTTPLILQPGDRITLQYGRRPLPGRPGPGASTLAREPGPIQAPVPVVAGFPFRLDLDERFNAWIAPHLPASPGH